MITRSANKKDSTQSDIVFIKQSQRINEKNASKNSNEKNIDDANAQNFPSPTFNIHIHVPYHDPKNARIFLPKIQPIIHLHFDEIAKKLEATMKAQNDKSLSKTLENWLTRVSPKFGNVQFHFKNSSEEKNIENSGISKDIPCSSHMVRNGIESNKNKSFNSAHNQNVVSKDPESLSNETSNNHIPKYNNKHEPNCQDLSNYKVEGNVKLKNAVVVLTDICKTKNYKKILAGNESAKNQSNKNNSLCDLDDQIKNTSKDKQECDTCFIKVEKESPIIESFTSDLYENNLNITDNCSVNSLAILPADKKINKSSFEKISKKNQNLTSLVEGWNFSDILNRFQIKSHELVNSAEYLNNTSQDLIDSELNSNKKKKEKKTFEGVEEDPCTNSESYARLNKNEGAFIEDNCLSENKSDGAESPSLLHVKNETENNIFSSHLDLGESKVYDFKKDASEEFKTEYSENQYYNSDSSADECENTSGKQVNSEAFLDLELVEPDLSRNKSNFVCENVFEEGAIKSSYLNDPEFHLVLIQKEMQRRALRTSASKSKNPISRAPKNLKSNETAEDESANSDSTPSPKKMKQSNKESKNSGQKSNSTGAENYILLNSLGSTQFAVASLDKPIPIKEHEAYNFKRNMLFSNRVNRFCNSDQLRVHQLKKDATKKMLNK